MRHITLKLIPGDGIGVEVMDEARRVLDALADLHGGVAFAYHDLPWSCAWSLEHGAMMPDDGLDILADGDAILLGAVGYPGVPDHVSLRGLLLPIRMGFDQYVNLRPVKLLPGLRSPLRVDDPAAIDFVVLRENTEGEYCGAGRLENAGTPDETAVQEARFTRRGTERIIRYAFEWARARGKASVVSATKSNALNHSMVFWDRVCAEVAQGYPEIRCTSMHVDALAGLFILKPQQLDVVVASNLFGDILTDLGSAMLGSIGISPSANLDPTGRHPSMFEPVHGSAPDIAGRGLANPTGMLWTVALMLEHLQLTELAGRLMDALAEALAAGEELTPDLGGRATTRGMTDAVLAALRRS
jgi:tartrate dehydrogenase/decarboxylase/D-malate dehydrogenase